MLSILLPVSLLPLIRIEATVVCTLSISKVALRPSLLMMRVLLRSTYTATNPSTSNSSTKAIRPIIALALGSSLTCLTALALRLPLDGPALNRASATTDTTVLLSIGFVSRFGGVGITGSCTTSSYASSGTGLRTETHKALHPTLASTSIELLTIITRANPYTCLTQTKGTMRMLVL